ncbi:plastocyanin/azurin family copper-binding protein [Roseivirga sp. BDSF3-8]|uniref:cupredoxin domain-containing protein n=1 Tax=Roseivirga sp. BDSF3-8 TaxID=3241598 RepID=UPI0035318350
MRSVFFTLLVIFGVLVILFNVFQQYRLERPIADVTIRGNQMLEPRVVTIKKGEEVSWINNTDSVQIVTSIPEQSAHAYLLKRSSTMASFHIGRIEPGKSRNMSFYEAGSYLYVCEVAKGKAVATGIINVEERE